jgi:hypothetical protein
VPESKKALKLTHKHTHAHAHTHTQLRVCQGEAGGQGESGTSPPLDSRAHSASPQFRGAR